MGSLFSSEEISSLAGGVKPQPPANYKLPTEFPPIHRAKFLQLDLESYDPDLTTKGPGWRRDAYIVGAGVSATWKDGTIFSEYYPCAHRDGGNVSQSGLFSWLQDELAFYTGSIVGANLLYDADGLQANGIEAPLAKWVDVQWAEALLDEHAYNYSLDTMSRKWLGKHKVKDELRGLYGPGWIERFRDIHSGHARNYVLGDVTLPGEILAAQFKGTAEHEGLKQQKLVDLFDLECRLLPMLIYMRKIGQRVDLAHAAHLAEMFAEERDKALVEATRLIGKRGIELNYDNFGQTTVLVRAFDELGIIVPRTALGNPSITDKWLENLEHPFGKLLSRANKYEKSKGTFVDGYITDCAIGGRIHCNFHPLRRDSDSRGGDGSKKGKKGTVTGRFSSSDPNLQNIPTRDDIIGPLCRAMFLPEEDMNFFSVDWSQIEFRLLVHAAVIRASLPKSEAKKRWGSRGEDIWERLQTAFKAQEMYLKDPKTDFHNMVVELTGLARRYAKSINFGIAFTMGVEKLAASIGEIGPDGKPTPKAHEVLKQYHDKVPFVKAVGQAMTHEAQEHGYVTDVLMRRARFDLWEPKFQDRAKGKLPGLPRAKALEAYGEKIQRADTHKALNSFTQPSGASMMKKAMVTLWESGLLAYSKDLIVSLTVHDELDGSVGRSERGKAVLGELCRMMETGVTLKVPVLVDCKTGKNWAETH